MVSDFGPKRWQEECEANRVAMLTLQRSLERRRVHLPSKSPKPWWQIWFNPEG